MATAVGFLLLSIGGGLMLIGFSSATMESFASGSQKDLRTFATLLPEQLYLLKARMVIRANGIRGFARRQKKWHFACYLLGIILWLVGAKFLDSIRSSPDWITSQPEMVVILWLIELTGTVGGMSLLGEVIGYIRITRYNNEINRENARETGSFFLEEGWWSIVRPEVFSTLALEGLSLLLGTSVLFFFLG